MISSDSVAITCGQLGTPPQCVHPSSDSTNSGFSLVASVGTFVITYLSTGISSIGILGGFFCFVICPNRLAVPTTHYLLIASSLIDFVYLSLEVVVHNPNFISGNRNGTDFNSYIFLGVLRTSIMLTQLLPNWIIVCLGLEWYLLVCHHVYFRT